MIFGKSISEIEKEMHDLEQPKNYKRHQLYFEKQATLTALKEKSKQVQDKIDKLEDDDSEDIIEFKEELKSELEKI